MVSHDVYAIKAISQIPRILTKQDRNPMSPTYGCFDRLFWLDKSIDFPTALAQFSVHSLALVYANQFPNNTYFKNPKIRDWCLAGIDYWMRIQHKDGSFDEFYPYERGWAGPTAFLLFAVLDSYKLLGDEFPKEMEQPFFDAAYRSAKYLAEYDEINVLANHHAIAALAVRLAHDVLDVPELLRGYERKVEEFLKWHTEEGWSYEYGGADPGYLSATISFFGKLFKMHPSNELLEILQGAIEFSSYFVYPNGFYAGTMGSRQTLHFYPHGFEILGHEIPLSGAVAERMLQGLSQGKLVPPEIMADRYFIYRVSEFLLSYLDYKPRLSNLPPLPYEREPFQRYFSLAKVYVSRSNEYYAIVNLVKGGVVKVFSLKDGMLIINDCGIIGQTDDGTVLSSQWIDNDYQTSVDGNHLVIKGHLNYIPYKYFNPFTMIVFRLGMMCLGWNTRLSYWAKGLIRKILVVGKRLAPVTFQREITLGDSEVFVKDTLHPEGRVRFNKLQIGDEFSVRYVPQSLYFQSQELGVKGWQADREFIDRLNNGDEITIERVAKVSSMRKFASSKDEE
ncbi:MAG: hypothetical protein KAV87_64255 [Desulfobacteraceae bacterium]|nr:hypothetical protein [Desulfobacteraceae bacterium]